MNYRNRIESRLDKCEEEGKKAFIIYQTAGLPDMAGTKDLIRIHEEAGTDI